jgi:hypothetical protein
MSSPIHLDEDIDPATMYAPPWARERTSSVPADAGVVPIRAAERSRKRRKSKPQFSGDRAMLELQRQLVLNPDPIPEPSPENHSIAAPIVFRLCGVVGFAALIAWSMVSYSDTKTAAAPASVDAIVSIAASDRVGLTNTTSMQPIIAAQTEDPISSMPQSTAIAAATSAPPVAPQTVPPTTSASNPPLATSAVGAGTSIAAPASPSPASSSAPQTNDRAVAQLDAEEIEMLLKRGKDFLADGDLASARLLLRRAAEGGSAEAALVLGTTYDPLVIQRLGVLGAHPDIGQARQWYQRAAELGSNTASQRLARLAAAP